MTGKFPAHGPVPRKIFPFDEVIMIWSHQVQTRTLTQLWIPVPPRWNPQIYYPLSQSGMTCHEVVDCSTVRYLMAIKRLIYIHIYIPISLWYQRHLWWESNCWSLWCSWSCARRRCSNYVFILDLLHGFNRLCKTNCKAKPATVLECVVSYIRGLTVYKLIHRWTGYIHTPYTHRNTQRSKACIFKTA